MLKASIRAGGAGWSWSRPPPPGWWTSTRSSIAVEAVAGRRASCGSAGEWGLTHQGGAEGHRGQVRREPPASHTLRRPFPQKTHAKNGSVLGSWSTG